MPQPQLEAAKLTPGEAAAMLRPAFPDAHVSVSEVVTRLGGENNTVYEVRCAEPVGGVIVKVYPEMLHWLQKKEAHVWRLLARHGVEAVPTVLYSAPDGGPSGRGHTVMSLLEGQPLAEVVNDLTPTELRGAYRRIGAFLATFHAIDQDAYGYLITELHDPEPDNGSYMRREYAQRLDEFAERGGDPVLHRRLRDHVAARAELFDHCEAPKLCHNDLHEGNVLVARGPDGWQVTGFVDAENVTAADPLLDLARTHYTAVGDDTAKWDALVEGYGPLPADWAERLALYRLYQALVLWDWFALIGGYGERLESIAEDLKRMLA